MRYVLLGLLIIILISPAYAVSVTPSVKEIDFRPNASLKGNCLSIENPGCVCVRGDGMSKVRIGSKGDILADIIKVRQEDFILKKPDDWTCMAYDIQFPECAPEAGRHRVQVTVSTSTSEEPAYLVVGTSQFLYVNVADRHVCEYVPEPITAGQLVLVGSPIAVLLLITWFLYRRRE